MVDLRGERLPLPSLVLDEQWRHPRSQPPTVPVPLEKPYHSELEGLY